VASARRCGDFADTARLQNLAEVEPVPAGCFRRHARRAAAEGPAARAGGSPRRARASHRPGPSGLPLATSRRAGHIVTGAFVLIRERGWMVQLPGEVS
jgi:hypothetical protein